MRQDKQIAIDLRRQGKSYLQIHKELGISKGTLSGWFKNVDFSGSIKDQNIKKILRDSSDRMKHMNDVRKNNLENLYQKIELEAVETFHKHKSKSLFIAGLMLYAGEGDNVMKNPVRLANSNPSIINVFKDFSLKYLPITMDQVKFWMLLYPELDDSICREKWKNFLDLGDKNFYKTQVISGKNSSRKLLFGVGNLIINGRLNKIRLLTWIKLVFQELRM